MPIFAGAVAKTAYPTYNDAKMDFESKGMVEKLELDGAKAWFKKQGYGTEFDDYFESRDFMEKKGYLKKLEKFYDGKGETSFAREGEEVDTTAFHDVMVAMFLSDFVYCLGAFRKKTKQLGFTDEGLKEEVVLGKSFDVENFSREEQSIVRSYEDEKGAAFDPKSPMVRLMQGNLKVSKDPNARTPEVSMAQFQDVLKYEGFQSVRKRFARELTITALHSFKSNKLYIHKFDAKYNDKNLVYCIAGRDRNNGSDATDLFLTFRGSVTSQDWIANLQAPLVDILLRHDKNSGRCFLVEQKHYQKIEIEKSLYDEFSKIVEESGYPLRVHNGFLGYLFANRGRNGLVDDDKDNDSMYTNIRLNLQRLLDNKNTVTNSLHVTGHSLGGALATLASFFLACDKDLNNRSPDWEGVKCISFAAPMVGNVSFQRAFEVLQQKKQYQSTTAKTAEGERLFRNIRVTNNRDIVPLVPFFSKYRHTAGVHIHLNRPSLLSFGKPRKPYMEVLSAHWKSTWNPKKPWRIFMPTSMITGLFATTLRFFGLITTTIPILHLVPYLMTKPFKGVFPPIAEFKAFFASTGLFDHAIFGTIATAVQAPLFKMGLIGVSWALLAHLFTKRNTSTPERAALLCLGVPKIISMTKYLISKAGHAQFAATWEVSFLVGVVVAQIACFFFRKPAEVLAFKTHFMEQYYKHLRPNHKLLSSSDAILQHVGEDMVEE